VDDWLATVERIQLTQKKHLAVIATLPCGTCTMGSPTAKDCGYYGKVGCKHQDEIERLREEDEKIRWRERNLLVAGLDRSMIKDPNVQMVVRGQLENRLAIRAVGKALCSPSLRFLVLGGPHRTGKTMALFYACATRTSTTYIRSQQLSRIEQDHDRWTSTQILVVNELGRENLGNGFTASNLDELMAEREYGNKLTIFATNLPMRKVNPHDTSPSLADRYGDLFASRIAPPIGAYVICNDGRGEA